MVLSQAAIFFICNCCKTLQFKRVGYIGTFVPLSCNCWCSLILVAVERVLLRAIFVSLLNHLMLIKFMGRTDRKGKKKERKGERKKKEVKPETRKSRVCFNSLEHVSVSEIVLVICLHVYFLSPLPLGCFCPVCPHSRCLICGG